MRTWILSLVVCILVLTSGSQAEDRTQPVREFDVSGLKVIRRNDVTKPLFLGSADELPKAIKDVDAVARLKKAVDFEKEKLALFTWSGSGQDQLTFAVQDDRVIFQYTQGRTKDLRQHTRLFVMPKDWTYNISKSDVDR